MDTALKVYTASPWIDFTRSPLEIVWTVIEDVYTWINIGIGVAFGAAQSSLERLVSHVFAWTCYFYYFKNPFKRPSVYEPVPRSSSPKGKPRGSRDFSARVFSGLLLFAGITWAVAGSFVTTIPANKAAMLASYRCGHWHLEDTNNRAGRNQDALFRGGREKRAAQYARNCYPPNSDSGLDQCLLFKTPYISSETRKDQPCPFVNKTYCDGTGVEAVQFTTGPVSAKLIGIKSGKSPYFKRSTICVPLNMKDQSEGGPGFIEKTRNETGYVGYKLGWVASDPPSPYTFEQYGDPFDYNVRAYTMSTYLHVYSMSARDNYLQPIPELAIRPELTTNSQPYSLTIMFINSCRIFYRESSEDPIFPAKGHYEDMWVNLDSRARPLACVDWIEACSHDGDCTPSYKKNLDFNEKFVFMRYALNKSTVFHSIEFQDASGLDAQSKIQDYESLPLSKDPPQWMLESWNLFNTSLARVQFDALDIANGTNSDRKPLYGPGMESTWMHGKLCRTFVFQVPKGYENVRILPVVGLLLIPLLLWRLAIEKETNAEASESTDSNEGMSANREATSIENLDFSEEQKNSRCFDGLKPIRAEQLYWTIKAWRSRARSKSEDKQTKRIQRIPHDAEVGEQGDAGALRPQSGLNYGTNQNLSCKRAAASNKPDAKPDPNSFVLTSPASTPSESEPPRISTENLNLDTTSSKSTSALASNPIISSSEPNSNVKPDHPGSEGQATDPKSSEHMASNTSSSPRAKPDATSRLR